MMDYFTKNKMLFWCVIILVLINIVTLTFFWVTKPPFGVLPGPERRPDGGKIMEEQLQLSAEQAQQFEQIRNKHFIRTMPLQDDIHKIRLDLLDEIFSSEPNQTKIQSLYTDLENKQRQFNELLFEHFQELKNTCNKEQVEELKIMLRDLIESTRPRDPRHLQPGQPGGFEPGRRPPPNR